MTAKERKSMKDRRSLVEGITPVDRTIEEQFVFAAKAKKPEPATPSVPQATTKIARAEPASVIGRMPLSTRVRADFATALKRASLERQLSGTVPNTLQDILEEALEPWLRSNGYLN